MITVGTDIVAVSRIRNRLGSEFITRWFSGHELDYCFTKAFPERHLAGRLAAKEAAFKSFNLDWSAPVPWRDIEIQRQRTGALEIHLSGNLERAALSEYQSLTTSVSISHEADFAIAAVVSIRV